MVDQSYFQEEYGLNEIDLQSIYFKLSESENINFDLQSEEEMILHYIEECYNQKFRMIDTALLQSNTDLLNLSFVKLVKFAQEKEYNRVQMLFCCYCDYFDLSPDIVFKNLHDKLQTLIKSGYAHMIGENAYKRMKRKYSDQQGYTQPTLFDLLSPRPATIVKPKEVVHEEPIENDGDDVILPDDIRREFENDGDDDDYMSENEFNDYD